MSDDSDGVLTVDVLNLDIVIIMFIVAIENGIKFHKVTYIDIETD